MRTLFLCAALAVTSIPAIPSQADAGVITRACMKSDRKAANRNLCRCIQAVANKTLSRSDQRMVLVKQPSGLAADLASLWKRPG